MGPIEIIEAAAKGAAEFASKHAVLTAATVMAASGASYVAYQNHNEADRAVGGGVVKQDVAVKDMRGDLSLKMQGVKEAPKANEPAKADVKSGNDEILKKLQDAAKDAGIMAEAAKAAEQTPAQPELPPETPYIPEQMKEDKTSTNVLDGNGSNVFKTANFASSGSGSAGSERTNAGKAQSGNEGGTKSVSGTGTSAPSAATAGSGAKIASTTSEAASSSKTEIAKTGGKKADGSATETGKGTLSGTKDSSDNKTETANTSNNSGETGPGKTPGNVAPMTNVDDTVSTVAATKTEKQELFNRSAQELKKENARRKELEALKAKKEAERKAEEAKQRRLQEEKRNGLRQRFLQVLRDAFEKEADCEVDEVVASSDRKRAGITSHEVMRLAAEPTMRAKCVTLSVDDDAKSSDLILLLTQLGAKSESERNPNLSFLLRNGSDFLIGTETIPGVRLYLDKSDNVLVDFPKPSVPASDKKKPDAGKTTGGKTTTATTEETKSDTTEKKGISLKALRGEFDRAPMKSGAKIAEDISATKHRMKNNILGKGDYNGSFEPGNDGILYDDDLASDLKNGLMPPDELIDGILEYNRNQAKKQLDDQKPIDVVNGLPMIHLSANQMARAKGLVFITDGEGAKEAEKDTKRFLTQKNNDNDTVCVFVYLSDGTLTTQQNRILRSIGFGNLRISLWTPIAKTEGADGNWLTAKIVIPKEFTNVLHELTVFSEIGNFLENNPLCKTKIKMHYRDADALKDCLTNACENDDAERLTLEFQNRLPNNFAATVNAEAALFGLNVATENNTTVRFQKVGKIDEDAVKAYFGTPYGCADILVFCTFPRRERRDEICAEPNVGCTVDIGYAEIRR